MFKQHENPLCIFYSTQKSDIGTELNWATFFNLHLWLGLFSDDFDIYSLPIKTHSLLILSIVIGMDNKNV